MVKKISKFLLVASFLTILVLPAKTYAVDWFPLVPCGLNTQPANATRQDLDANGKPIGPHDYTQKCNQCLLVELGKNVIDMTFYAIVPSVGTLLFLIAGFVILFNARSGNPAGVGKGKQIMTDTAIGIAIVLASWLITNFILKSLVNDQVVKTPWYQIDCKVGTLENLVNATTPNVGGSGGTGIGGGGGSSTQHYSCASDGKSCVSDPNGQYTDQTTCSNACLFGGGRSGGGGGGASFQNYACNSSNQCIPDANGQYTTDTCDGKCQATIPTSTATPPLSSKTPIPTSTATPVSSKTPTPGPTSTTTPTSSPSKTPTPTPGLGTQCLQSGLNLCQGNAPTGCANKNCNQYAAVAASQATGVATASVLKAFMEVESSCDIRQVSGTSYGLMQITPPIPQIYGTRCGMSKSEVDQINQTWLTNPVNVEKSVCIAAQWINAIATSQCGSSVRNLYAGYNGGQAGACAPSVSCAGEKSCSSEPMKRWECLYDDTAHTKCNGGTDIMAGYNQTRQGATRIQYCAANPGF